MKYSSVILILIIILTIRFQKVSTVRLESRMVNKCQDLLENNNVNEFENLISLCLQMVELLNRKRKEFKYESLRETFSNIDSHKEKNERLYQIFSKINRLSGMRRVGR